MKPFPVALLLLSFLVLSIAQERSPKALAGMTEEEAFSQLLKYAGIPEEKRFQLADSLEIEGWEIISSLVEEGPSNEAAIGKMIRIVGLHPSSTRYSVNQARMILRNVTPRIQELLDDERRLEYAEFRAADPFGGTGSKDAPEGYDKFFLSLRYFDGVAEGAMNIIAVKGDAADLELLEPMVAVKSEPFPVSFSSMAEASKDILKKRLEERTTPLPERDNGSQFDSKAEPKQLENQVEVREPNGDAQIQGQTEESPSLPTWALAVIVVAVLGILILLIRVFLRGRAS